MKLLVLYPYIPYPLNRGAYHRAFHLLKGLARHHEVHLLALAEKCEGLEHQSVFEEFCAKVTFVSFEHPDWERLFPKRLLNPLPSTIAHWTVPAVEAAIDEALAAHRYDAVHVCDIVLAQYFLGKNTQIPLLVDRTRVDLFYQRMERENLKFSVRQQVLNRENFTKLWFFERAIAKRSALQVVCGIDDADYIRDNISKKVPIAVIPNGVDVDYFKPEFDATPRDEAPTVIFCGAMDYNPNIDALRWYFGSMHEELTRKVPEMKVLIVGKDPGAEIKAFATKFSNVTVTGGVPDVRPFYKRAWIQIVPLRIGGGTRLKIVESMAIGTPVVSTTIGAQGLDLRHDADILLADTPATFVREAARALAQPALRETLREQGMRTVRTRLAWPSLGDQLSDIYDRTLGVAPRTGSKTAAVLAAEQPAGITP